jgi:acyl carrier protein
LNEIKKNICEQVGGIFHFANQYTACSVDKINKKILHDALNKKVYGIYNVISVFNTYDLLFLTGSISELFGNSGQVTYNIANSSLYNLAKDEYSKNKKVLYFAYPLIVGTGRLSNPEHLQELKINIDKGIGYVSVFDINTYIEKAIVLACDRKIFSATLLNDVIKKNMNSYLFDKSNSVLNDCVDDSLVIYETIVNKVVNILQCSKDEENLINIELRELGITSLTSIELMNWCNKTYGIDVKSNELLNGISVNDIYKRVVNKMNINNVSLLTNKINNIKIDDTMMSKQFELPIGLKWSTVNSEEVTNFLNKYYLKHQTNKFKNYYTKEYIEWYTTRDKLDCAGYTTRDKLDCAGYTTRDKLDCAGYTTRDKLDCAGYTTRDHVQVQDQAQDKLDHANCINKNNNWMLAIRTNKDVIIGIVIGVRIKLRIKEELLDYGECNYLCVHPNFRDNKLNLSVVLINEISRIMAHDGIHGAIYTSSGITTVPILETNYCHKLLNIPNLMKLKYCKQYNEQEIKDMSVNNLIKKTNLRRAKIEDFDQIYEIYNNDKRDIEYVMNNKEFFNFFNSSHVNVYVTEQKECGKVMDYVSVMNLNKLELEHGIIIKECLLYYHSEVNNNGCDLINDLLILLNEEGYDILTLLDITDYNNNFINELNFIVNDAKLYYYLFNCKEIKTRSIKCLLY